MLSEQDLVEGTMQASGDVPGVDTIIDSLYDDVMKRHVKIYRLIESGKHEEATQLRETLKEMRKEINDMIQSQMLYKKYKAAAGKASGAGKGGPAQPESSSHIKKQKHANGDIVREIPTH